MFSGFVKKTNTFFRKANYFHVYVNLVFENGLPQRGGA